MTNLSSGPLAAAELELGTELGRVPGIGRARASALAKAGLRTVADLLWLLPFRHEDRSRLGTVRELEADRPATVRVTVMRARLVPTRRPGFSLVEASFRDPTGTLQAVFFNQPYLVDTLQPGTEVYLYGTPERRRLFLEMRNPQVERLGGEGEVAVHTGRVVPVYERLGSFGPRAHRALVARLLEALAGRIPELLPGEVIQGENLLSRELAFREAHLPSTPDASADGDEPGPAIRRLAFEELFLEQLALALARRTLDAERGGIPLAVSHELRDRLALLLPFRLTRAQRRVAREMLANLATTTPMRRLLQGDVGSGKTILAAIALAVAAGNGRQGALMAPTELLAEQHARNLAPLFARAGMRAELLTAERRGAARRALLGELGRGELPIVIGTHALLEPEVEFRSLAVVVIDEQHRFGVAQREALRQKGLRPHVLVMTATPIPRSLALTAYGDLELSVLDELPPGRRPVRTVIKTGDHEDQAYAFLRREIESGSQAYVVCPLVEGTEKLDLKAAVEWAESARVRWLRGVSTGLVHGKMKAADRRALMERFRAGEIQVLFGTTVLEVGVDVPNASVMLVEHAERFGLSQLHQLRGRIGRGRRDSTCILMVREKVGGTARSRLEAVRRTSDGFAIAEADLRLRGPGDLSGTRQWGMPGFRVARVLRDFRLLERARAHAARLAADERWLSSAAAAPLLAALAARRQPLAVE